MKSRDQRRALIAEKAGGQAYSLRSRWAAIGLALLSLGLQSLIFPPMPSWPLAFVCLVPWLLVVSGSPYPRFVYLLSYGLGFTFFLINMYWMYFPTGAGYVALSAYLAVYFPLMACPLRHAARRRRIPLAVALPVVWVGGELLRALVISGFPWFLLGHSAYRWLSLIQISDLAGAYGVSFVLAAINGAVADAWMRRRRGASWLRPGLAWPIALLAMTLIYGQIQLGRRTKSAGPRVAIVQGDYPNFVDPELNRAHPDEVADFYFTQMSLAEAQHPDLYVLPESAWSMYLNREFLAYDSTPLPDGLRAFQGYSRYCYERFVTFVRRANAYVVTGSGSLHYNPYDLLDRERKYNSAFIFAPPGGPPRRYDKVHVVPFGETIPFRYGRLRFLYLWFNRISPFYDEEHDYSMCPGARFDTFTMRSPASGREYRFAIPICYEDVMPYVARRFVTGGAGRRASEKQIDFLLNISNDGWFNHSTELPQHLAISTFRAVENRVAIARSVNTGISAFIDSDGQIRDAIPVGSTGYRVAKVTVDGRFSLYTRYGDVFAWTCCLIWASLYLDYTVARIRGRPVAPLPSR